jgi:broad specificity phosphatase PhoE
MHINKMEAVFIRHSLKEYANGKSEEYKFDPPLTQEGITAATHAAFELEQIYGQFDVIITSPFRRCLQTAAVIASVFSQMGKPIRIIKEPMVGEYLGNHKSIDEEDFRCSITDDVIFPETIEDLRKRVSNFERLLGVKLYRKPLIVTHGIFMQMLSVANQSYKELDVLPLTITRKKKRTRNKNK